MASSNEMAAVSSNQMSHQEKRKAAMAENGFFCAY